MERWDSARGTHGSGGTTMQNPWTAGRTAVRARGPKFLKTEAGRIESGGEVKLQAGGAGDPPWASWLASSQSSRVVQPSLAPSSLPGLVSSRSQRWEAPLGWCPPASRAMQGLVRSLSCSSPSLMPRVRGAEAALPTETTTLLASASAKPERAWNKSASGEAA